MTQVLLALAVTPYQVVELVVVAATPLLIYGIMREASHSLTGYARLLVIGVLVVVAVIYFASVALG